MSQPDRPLAVAIAQAVQARFASLPKTGKPQPHEHTVLAGIVAYRHHSNGSNCHGDRDHTPSGQPAAAAASEAVDSSPQVHVVALGTGTKCLGGSKCSAAGDLLHDSHAEVITRRAFMAWIQQQLTIAAAELQQHHQNHPPPRQQQVPEYSTKPIEQQQVAHTPQNRHQSAFVWCPGACKFMLRPGINFAMYVSQPPCGDASIYEAAGPAAAFESDCSTDKEQHQASSRPKHQQQQLQPSGRTGAKLLKPAGAADVAAAAAAVRAAATAGTGAKEEAAAQTMYHSDGAAARQDPSLHSVLPAPAGQQQDTDKHEQQHADHHQQKQQQQPPFRVPDASDVEAGPQQLGVLRRKPGKGDPTLSLSCSDKIARWACLGLQGSLLSSLLVQPLYLSMLVISAPPTAIAEAGQGPQQQQQQQCRAEPGVACAAAAGIEAAGRRAFAERLHACAAVLPAPFELVMPSLVVVDAPDAELGLWPGGLRKVPSGMSINWSCQLPLLQAADSPQSSKSAAAGLHEVTSAAFGRKAGASRKGPAASSIKTRSRISSAALFEQWQELAAAVPQQDDKLLCGVQTDVSTTGSLTVSEQVDRNMSRDAVKEQAAPHYVSAWKALKTEPYLFAGWLVK